MQVHLKAEVRSQNEDSKDVLTIDFAFQGLILHSDFLLLTLLTFSTSAVFLYTLSVHALSAIRRLSGSRPADQLGPEAREIFLKFRDALTRGEIRAAEQTDGQWKVNVWVKQGILLGFRLGEITQMGSGECLSFVDKDTFPARKFTVADKVRVVPGGLIRAASALHCAVGDLHAADVHQRRRLR